VSSFSFPDDPSKCSIRAAGGLLLLLPPVGRTGVTRPACRWVTTPASRFDAEVGLVRIDQSRTGSWRTFSGAIEPSLPSADFDSARVLATLCLAGIDADESTHPGGSDTDALARLRDTGAFDAPPAVRPFPPQPRPPDHIPGTQSFYWCALAATSRGTRAPLALTTAAAGFTWLSRVAIQKAHGNVSAFDGSRAKLARRKSSENRSGASPLNLINVPALLAHFG